MLFNTLQLLLNVDDEFWAIVVYIISDTFQPFGALYGCYTLENVWPFYRQSSHFCTTDTLNLPDTSQSEYYIMTHSPLQTTTIKSLNEDYEQYLHIITSEDLHEAQTLQTLRAKPTLHPTLNPPRGPTQFPTSTTKY